MLVACDTLACASRRSSTRTRTAIAFGINRDLQRGLLAAMRVIGPAAVADQIPGLTEPVHPDDVITFAGIPGRVILTDGHLTGHVSYVFDDLAFVGDSLFTGGCGYVFTGPMSAMFEGLMRLAALPPDTWIFCAHEYTEDNLRFAVTLSPTTPTCAPASRPCTNVAAKASRPCPSGSRWSSRPTPSCATPRPSS